MHSCPPSLFDPFRVACSCSARSTFGLRARANPYVTNPYCVRLLADPLCADALGLLLLADLLAGVFEEICCIRRWPVGVLTS
jgi:hypothetical protein